MLRHIMVELLKTEDEKAAKEEHHFTCSGFLIRNYKGLEEEACFSSAEGRELSTQFSLK